MNKLLELKNVSLTYQTKDDEIQAIENLSFSCNQGDFLSIIGPSGCGKTTILSLISGLIKPTSGNIEKKEDTTALKFSLNEIDLDDVLIYLINTYHVKDFKIEDISIEDITKKLYEKH